MGHRHDIWSRSHSLQRKIITAIVMVGLLPLILLLALTYVEERRALREMTGANFKEVAVEAARRIEMQVSRGMNEASNLPRLPFCALPSRKPIERMRERTRKASRA